MPKTFQSSQGTSRSWKQRFAELLIRVKSLQGDPHYVAKGMAIGVFVAFTPTIPFHTVLTIALAFIVKGSKPAALIGSWLNNPLTFPFFYYGSFKLGIYLLGHDIPMHLRYDEIKGLMALGWDVAAAILAGGVLLGILPAMGVYFITSALFRKMRAGHGAGDSSSSASEAGSITGCSNAGNGEIRGRSKNRGN